MGGGLVAKYSNAEALIWYESYKDRSLTVKQVSSTHQVKHETMLSYFRRLGLELRPSGFKVGNARGLYGQDLARFRFHWLYKFAYKRRAARKNLDFSLSLEEFIILVTSACYYCGKSYLEETRSVRGKLVHMLTVDRVDSNKGYVMDNCVPACKSCNTIKMDATRDEFLNRVTEIYKHSVLRKTG